MLVLSFNTRGLGSSSKIKALKRMIVSLKHTIILLQKTMMEGTKVKEVLEPWLKDWNFAYIISDGQSGGLIIA